MAPKRKIIVYIATSADGFIARRDGSVDWLDRPAPKGHYGMLKAHRETAPLQRNVEVAEVGSTGVFLASDASSGITGETLYVDCGYNIMGFKPTAPQQG